MTAFHVCTLAAARADQTRARRRRYGNIFGQPGEYASECMLVCPSKDHLPCMPLPCMSHQRNKYQVEIKGSLRTMKQLRVQHEDFVAPSCLQAATK